MSKMSALCTFLYSLKGVLLIVCLSSTTYDQDCYLTGFVSLSDSPDPKDAISPTRCHVLAIHAELDYPNSVEAALDLLDGIQVIELSIAFLIQLGFLLD